MTGIAFETRLTNNTIPNRTLSSFIPGKKVSSLSINTLIRKKEETVA
jgi:hypothetical protein